MTDNHAELTNAFRAEIIRYYADDILRIRSNVERHAGHSIRASLIDYLEEPGSFREDEDDGIRFSLMPDSSSDNDRNESDNVQKTADEYHEWEKKNASYDSFSGRFEELFEDSGLSSGEFFERCHIDRKLLSKIRTDFTYHPSKLTAIRACFGLGLSLENALDLLDLAGFTLSSSSSFDLAIRYFLIKGITDVDLANEILEYLDEEIFL